MSELDIARLLNDKVVDFGNERFLEGWNGATEHIIKLLEQMPQNDGAKSAGFGDLLKREAAIALIKGENN